MGEDAHKGRESKAMSLRVLTWNVEWAAPGSWRYAEVLRRVERLGAEVVCLTETNDALLSQAGHRISSQADYGYPVKAGRRKVMLWSREPWEQVDDLGIDSMPPGRFISGVTQTSSGKVRVIGVCIPWFGSRTEAKHGLERKLRWEDHGQYIAGLGALLKQHPSEPLIVMGDFNQIVGPGNRAPSGLQSALHEAFQGMTIATSDLAFQGRRSIDHIALSADLTAESVNVISNAHGERRLSDHFGVAVDVARDTGHAPRGSTGSP